MNSNCVGKYRRRKLRVAMRFSSLAAMLPSAENASRKNGKIESSA